jgi:predicted O-methyltransferase YrrM
MTHFGTRTESNLPMDFAKIVARVLIRALPFRVIYRTFVMLPFVLPRLIKGFLWTWQKTENSNFYYDLTDKNILELAQFVSIACNIESRQAEQYINEARQDEQLHEQIHEAMKKDKSMKNSNLQLGRRLGWYAVIRAMKPKLVVETGVHQGLGSITIISALIRNTEDGFSGRYLGTDLDPRAGVLLQGRYLEFGELLYGDSIESLEKISEKIDVFINDSDHSATYEAREYEVITSKLGLGSIILGDNCHVTDALIKYSLSLNRKFLFFKEEPKSHWYPGAGIGFSFE